MSANDYWFCNCPEGYECRCYNLLGQRVPCEDLNAGLLASGAYIQRCENDDDAFYQGTSIDLGSDPEDVMHGLHGEIVNTYHELNDGIVFYISVFVAGLTLIGVTALFLKELKKLAK